MNRFARIAVNVPQVSGLFDYAIPQPMLGGIRPGCLVVVPFGKLTVQGIVVQCMEQSEVPEVKSIQSLMDEKPVVTSWQLDLARWLSEQSLQPLQACLDLFVPPGLHQQADTLYQRTARISEPGTGLSPLQQRILEMLERRGNLRGRQLEHAFARANWKPAAQALIRQGWVTARSVLPPPTVHPKTIRTARLSVIAEKAVRRITDISRSSAALERRTRAIRFLNQEAVEVNVAWVYAESGCQLDDLRLLAEEDLIILGEQQVIRDPLENLTFDPGVPPTLTSDQAEAWKTIRLGLHASRQGARCKPYLLHGVTGSGKTEIYLRAVAETLQQGRQALVLVPEIALTPQTVRRFAGRFPGQVGLIHSRLSPGERYDTWRRIRDGLLPVVVGPRSALFSPFADPGLIILDECHDASYYQEDSLPSYSTTTLAGKAGELAGSLVLFGSASPSVEMMFQANREGWERLELPLRILAHRSSVHKTQAAPFEEKSAQDEVSLPLPKVTLVDMRDELKNNNRSIISSALKEALAQVLKSKQQAILFLNRRGSSTYVFCRKCGLVLECPRCNMPLTWHEIGQTLKCHQCGYARLMPSTCPACASDQVRQFGTGTERVEKVLRELFPSATTLRWDAESTREKGSHEVILSHFINHRADFLIGTQMLAKGLDLPLVTLVGVILADVGLFMPDFRAAERTFQVLMQVSGRAGRSPLGGRVILQTFHPENYAIAAASRHDYAGFFREEIARRKAMVYPPFSQLVRMEIRGTEASGVGQKAEKMRMELENWIRSGGFQEVSVIGPAPCFYARLAGNYRWQIILRGREPMRVLRGHPLGEWRISMDPQNLL